MKPVIFLDMDDVMVDFVGAAYRIHGLTDNPRVKNPGVWDMTVTTGLSPEEFWRPINEAGESFWLGLQPLPWLLHLLALVDSEAEEWYVVTSPSRCPGSYSGKRKWLRRYFGEEFNRYVLTAHKHLLARKGTLLIDDRQENVVQFRRAGGRAITFPTLGNGLYEHADDPIGHLQQIFEGSDYARNI